MKTAFKLFILAILYPYITMGQQQKKDTTVQKKWYESFAIRGYVQIRYNRLLETNPRLQCEQCDRSWGANGGVFIRRGRIIISGNLTKNVFFYIQPDFGSATGTTQNIFQLRDAYIDLGLDAKNEFRLRFGQSKVPFGFENMQSSQNRLPLDRADALNSAVANERDLGVFFYWAPKKIRNFFSDAVRDNLKGSGDYGVFALGVYNGQTANRAEQNNQLHVVSRLSYPFRIGNQVIEPGVQAYVGNYVLPPDLRSAGVRAVKNFEFRDERIAGSFILYPKPFGIQAEYNVGRGPQYNPQLDSIETRNLQGGYATFSYLIPSRKKNDRVYYPFTRVQYYKGGKKHEIDARSYNLRELEVGLEWQLNRNFEFTTMYTISRRRFEDSRLKNNLQTGSLLRLQAQLNF